MARSLLIAKILAFITIAALTGCSAKGLTTPDGSKLDNGADQLAEIEQLWRASKESQQVKVRFSDKAKCFLQVSRNEKQDQIKAGETVLCGPYREMASENTSWDKASIVFSKENKKWGFSLSEPTETAFQPVQSIDPDSWWQVDDQKPDNGQVVSEPDAPTVEYGQIVTPSSTAPPNITATDPITTPDGIYQTKLGISERIGGPLDRKMVKDGVFASIQIQRSPALDADYENLPQKTKIQLQVGSEVYPIGEQDYFSIAVPNDGSELKIQFVYDEVTQELDAKGVRGSNEKASAYYKNQVKLKVETVEAKAGASFQDGWYFRTTFTDPKIQLTPWTKSFGWAKSGRVWLVVDAKLVSDGPKYFSGYEQEEYTNNRVNSLTNVTLDSIKAAEASIGSADSTGSLPIHLVFSVPATSTDFNQLSMTFTTKAEKSTKKIDGSPSKAERSLVLITKISPRN